MSRSSYAAFAHRDFRIYQSARVLSMTGRAMQSTAVGYQVYSITNEPLSLGWVGLAQFLPAFVLSLVTGHTADRFDRRAIVMICQAVLASASLGLYAVSASGAPQEWQFYLLLVIVGTAHAFYGPAGQALMPQLVPKEHFPNAVAWNSSIWQLTAIIGPALGGLIYARFGPAAVYAADAAATMAGFGLVALMHTRTGRMEKAELSWDTVLAGLRFIWFRKAILGAVSLDLFAVLLGGAVALLPIYARDILKVGETGFGIMRSAPAVGAAITAILLAHMPPLKRAGVTMFAAVALFGVGTILFALSKTYLLSVACLIMMGASDMVSVVVRHTLVQVMTPPEMRGRVSAVNLVFIGASNELGEFESGLTAHWFGVVPAAVLGGVGTLIVVVIWSLTFPQLRKAKRLDQLHY